MRYGNVGGCAESDMLDLTHLPDLEGRERMEQCLQRYGGDVELSCIGRSILGREIRALKIGKGRGRVAYFAAHHASEYITTGLLYMLAATLLGVRGYQFPHGTDRETLLSLYT